MTTHQDLVKRLLDCVLCREMVEAAAIIESQAAELEALRKDAERYRWLRQQPHSTWHSIGWNTWNDAPSVFSFRDEHIDAAMQKETS